MSVFTTKASLSFVFLGHPLYPADVWVSWMFTPELLVTGQLDAAKRKLNGGTVLMD
jgi:hypothetical protein